MLVKNEADRWLIETIAQMQKLCDRLIFLDDGSTDETPEICEQYGEVHRSRDSFWATNEIMQRRALWDLATAEAKEGDWILCLDADEILVGDIEYLKRDIEIFGNALPKSSIAFPLYDMWDEEHYREDQYWNAHTRPWEMMVRYHPSIKYVWREQKLHCGRFPLNAGQPINAEKSLYFIPKIKIKHMGWSTPEDRRRKYIRYINADPDGKYGIKAQYESILDENPNVVRFEP